MPEQDGLERVADFVSDAGGEGAEGLDLLGLDQARLGGMKILVGYLQLRMGALQFIHGLPALGDIPGNDDDLVGATALVEHHAAERLNVANGAIAEQQSVLGALSLAGGQRVLEYGLYAGAILGVDLMEGIGAGQSGGIAEAAFVSGIVVEPAAVPVHHGDQVGDILGDEPEELFALSEPVLDPFALDGRTEDAKQFAAAERVLDQVILGAFPHGQQRSVVIIGGGQEDDREVGGRLLQLRKRGQAGAGSGIGAEQQRIERSCAQMLLGCGDLTCPGQGEPGRGGFGAEFAQSLGERRVGIEEEQS